MGINRRSIYAVIYLQHPCRLFGTAAGAVLLFAEMIGALCFTPLRARAEEGQAAAYSRAAERFRRNDDERAPQLPRLDGAQAGSDARSQSDTTKLRGVVYLRQHRCALAGKAFPEAHQRAPRSWDGDDAWNDADSMPPMPKELTSPSGGLAAGPEVLAKPSSGGRKGRATPSPQPSATPAASPGAATSSPGATPVPSASASGSPAAASATPAASPEPAFIQAYEAAYVQFLEEKYDEAKNLLDKADSIQPGQPSSVSLRNQIFKHFYGEAYLRYASKDYDGAVKQLDAADKILPDQADANNMRGLIFSRMKNYRSAEDMFKKSIAQDPTFWEAKFNLAELPFIYKNYPEARGRFENLFGQTDQAKQPKEAELTEFKVFLTLLLEGKEQMAKSFMERFNFTGATPARYYCQAALDFIHGDTDKALGWIQAARKEYPAKLESIFAQSFFRVGWLTDANAAALAAATPATGALPTASPALAAASPAATAPTEVAMASPAKSVGLATPSVGGTAAPAATDSVAVSASASPMPAMAEATPAVPSSSQDLLRVPTPGATPAASAPSTVSEVPPQITPPAVPATTPEPTAAPAKTDEGFSLSDILVLGFLGLVTLLTLANAVIGVKVVKAKQERQAKKPLRYSGQTSPKPQEASTL